MKTDCNCVSRQYNSGVGFNGNYNLMRGFGLDSTVNVLPGQGGSRGMVEGLFGFKWGERWEKMGLFAKVRPGFIYYQDAMPGGGVYTAQPLTRFAADLGGIVEYYPSRNSTMRFDVGTTLVRYLTNRADPSDVGAGQPDLRSVHRDPRKLSALDGLCISILVMHRKSRATARLNRFCSASQPS